MKRRVVLVALPFTREKDPPIPLGHGSLLASLQREARLDVRSVVRAVNQDPSIVETTDTILSHVTGVPASSADVAIGAYIWNESFVLALLRSLRASGFKGRIVLGGPQVSYAGQGLERLYPEADVFIRGHAEDALRAVVLGCGRSPITGVHYAGEVDDRIKQAVTTFETLPSPWLSGATPIRGGSFLRWETQRGCRFRCSFCQHRQPDSRVPCATLPDERIKREIDLFCQAGIRQIAVLDPLFNNDPSHANRVLAWFVEGGYRGELSLQCRAELINDAFLDAAQALDVRLEFGVQSIQKREYLAVGRPNNMGKVAAVLAAVRRRKIKHEVSLIFGLPEQTLESFQESVQWCLAQRVPIIKAFPLLLLRGTDLEKNREKWRLMVDTGELPMVVESETFTFDDWQQMRRIAEALSRTEGRHPPSVQGLLRAADDSSSDLSGWCERAIGRGL